MRKKKYNHPAIWLLSSMTLNLLAAIPAHAQLRPMVYSETTVTRTVDDVWQDWTSVDGLESHFAPKAVIDLRPGGAYEVWFLPDAPKGQRGAEDGVILGLQTDAKDGTKMIQFTWKMPPYMPEINTHMTVVQMWFIPETDKTRIRLFHTGFGDTQNWREARDYFATTWPKVLSDYKIHTKNK